MVSIALLMPNAGMFRLAGPLYRFSLAMPGMATALHMLAELMLSSAVVLILLRLYEALHTMHRFAAAFLMLGIAYVGCGTFLA
jgi:hypothetical protein